MDAPPTIDADVVIFGGGCAGLWLLDELRRRRVRALLLEAHSLGTGQTANSQGILHGGLKYSLAGILSPSAHMVRDMPAVWQASLAGRVEPDLSTVKLRSPWCCLWRSPSLTSWTAMLGAVAALRVKPVPLPDDEHPAPLSAAPKPIYRLDEPVIDPLSFLRAMAHRNAGSLWKIDAEQGLQLETSDSGNPVSVALTDAHSRRQVRLQTRWLVLSAGEGNERLREQLRLPSMAMQRRPLRIALLRGHLPRLNGHCVEGTKTKVTITSDVDSAGRTIWQLGGQVTEDGVAMDPSDFLRHARRELSSALSGWQPEAVEWSTLVVHRAEGPSAAGSLPNDVQILRDGNVLTAWPTKLVLAPRLAQRVVDILGPIGEADDASWRRRLAENAWPAPAVASPSWEGGLRWQSDV